MMNGHGPHNTTRQEEESQQHEERPFQVVVSIRFCITSLLASCLLAYCVGRAARASLLGDNYKMTSTSIVGNEKQCNVKTTQAPLPAFTQDFVPQSRYLAKNFDTTMSASSSSWLAKSRDTILSIEEKEEEDSKCNHDDNDKPVAEHLQVDIQNVEAAFLNSETRLANAMLEVVRAGNFTLLSYHCHGLTPSGVSCVGVLQQNYVSFHTWPQEGVITLDLCVGGATDLVAMLPVIQQVFGVPRSSSSEAQPEMSWACKQRGYPEEVDYTVTDRRRYLFNDLFGTKERVASVKTDFQTIEVYDGHDVSKEELINEYDNRPDRKVLLDGIFQSSLLHEAPYHEALVHPGLFAHANPKRVAVIGGGECATLREVLKHDTVEEAIMIEIDEKMVNASRKCMPEWSDCSDIQGSASWCGDDPRATIYYEDALSWFVNRYSSDQERHNSPGPIDVIIMDALDPESEVPFAEALYNDRTFMQSFYDSLRNNGVLVMQLGQSPDSFDPDERYSKHKNRFAVTQLLEEVGFQSVHTYEEGACGFGSAWLFVVAFKKYSTRKRWFSNTAEVNLAILNRARRSISGANPFVYFDGSTMQSYQVPPRAIETVFCRRRPVPDECLDADYIYDPELASVPISSLEVRVSEQGKKAGRGVYAKQDIPANAFIAPEADATTVRLLPSTYKIIEGLYEDGPLEDLLVEQNLPWEGKVARQSDCIFYYMHAYGFTNRKLGARGAEVDSTIITFINHGCYGEYNIGEETEVDEFTANRDKPVKALDGKSHSGSSTGIFNPVVDRHLLRGGDTSLQYIKAGEELLDNYLAFIGSEVDWKDDIRDLRKMCSGKIIDYSVTDYEEFYEEKPEKGT